MLSLRKCIFILAVFALVSLIAFPWALYGYSLRLVSSKPEKATQTISNSEFTDLWECKESMNPGHIAGISPYWFYRWLFSEALGGNVPMQTGRAEYANVSTMSGVVALNHIRSNHSELGDMLWWHISRASLGIWLQRNWTAKEIAEKYRETMMPNKALKPTAMPPLRCGTAAA